MVFWKTEPELSLVHCHQLGKGISYNLIIKSEYFQFFMLLYLHLIIFVQIMKYWCFFKSLKSDADNSLLEANRYNLKCRKSFVWHWVGLLRWQLKLQRTSVFSSLNIFKEKPTLIICKSMAPYNQDYILKDLRSYLDKTQSSSFRSFFFFDYYPLQYL